MKQQIKWFFLYPPIVSNFLKFKWNNTLDDISLLQLITTFNKLESNNKLDDISLLQLIIIFNKLLESNNKLDEKKQKKKQQEKQDWLRNKLLNDIVNSNLKIVPIEIEEMFERIFKNHLPKND